jgi:beta-mannosidase
MESIDLCGSWTLRQAVEKKKHAATVPGCVHMDLLAAGAIKDPFDRDNELRLQWIGEADWVYSRSFNLPADFLTHARVILACEMLDTLATVKVNGRLAGKADNMFRTWEFDAKKLLKLGRNEIEVRFDSTLPYMKKRARSSNKVMKGDPRHWVRKEPCNYGWDWGPTLVTCGIQRPIRLVAFDAARLADVHVRQDHSEKGSVKLDVSVEAEAVDKPALTAAVSVSRDGEIKAAAEVSLRKGAGRAKLVVKNPELWWPAGMGDQPLYDLTVDLLDEEGDLLDTDTKRIGLRTLKTRRKRDRWGESFEFRANGVSFFAKGANWVPADAFASRVTRAAYARLIWDARAAHMNMLRVWGGGIYEEDCFYEICDELGICVWQDFMFACNTYPAHDRQFMASVRAEAEDNVRRIRHHPCIALWCGNNELEQFIVPNIMSWTDYKKLFDVLLPEVIGRFDPDRDYWPSSGHSPHGNREDDCDPRWGDAHLWAVWHCKEPFEWYRTAQHRFVSEFGFQSFPEPRTVEGYTKPEDRNITSFVMEHHQRSGNGNTLIMQYMLDWFRLPEGFESTLWLSQILQSLAIKYAVEHWRRNMPRTMGALYWQINDCWPVASWASIDSEGRWKALHYAAKKFFAPVMVSGVENPVANTVEVHVTSDLPKAAPAKLRWTVTDAAGKKLSAGAKTVRVPARASSRVEKLDLAGLVKKQGARDILVWLELSSGSDVLSTNLVTFAKPKHLELSLPEITTKVAAVKDGGFRVTLRAKRPALWTRLELAGMDARYSDNFLHLAPGRPVTVEVRPAKSLTREQLRKKLMVRSLVDTYQKDKR